MNIANTNNHIPLNINADNSKKVRNAPDDIIRQSNDLKTSDYHIRLTIQQTKITLYKDALHMNINTCIWMQSLIK